MRKVEGSMTVEASLLMPMVIFILAGLCYSFFFMHDYIVMQNEGYRRTEAELWHRETEEDMPVFMDATDGLAAAYCHFLQMGRPAVEKGYHGWKDFIAKNPDKVKKGIK